MSTASTSSIIIGSATTYRPDIDGLRAIAVLSVVAFHGFPTLLTGGYVGVDIFFVISGYLITSIIGNELVNDRFSFVEFYCRRVRRIFPALILVMLACIIAGWHLLIADEYSQLGFHVAAGASFLSNVLLWAQSGYFDNASEVKPLLHLWSLGIEEQFYIAWPLFLWAAHKTKFNFAQLAGLGILMSFVWNVAVVNAHPVTAFYMPYCRVWELLVGSTLAILKLNRQASQLPLFDRYKDHMAWLGLLVLVCAECALNKDSQFPGWWALLPTTGAALLIAANGSWINTKVLSHRFMVWFGVISYPLYLWHWSLLSFGRIVQNGEMAASVRVGLIALAIALAFLTCRYFEKYLRHQGNKIALLLCLSMGCVGYLGWKIHARDGLDFRYRNMAQQPEEMTRDFLKWEDKGMYPTGICEPDFVYPNAHICLQSNSKKQPDVVVFGDSHAFHAYWGIARALGSESVTVKLVGRGGCTFALYHNDNDCSQTFVRQVQWMATQASVKTVFVIHRLVIQNEMSDAEVLDYRQRLDSLFKQLTEQKKRVVYLYSVPEGRLNPRLCGGTLPLGRKLDLSGCVFPLSRELDIQKTNRELVNGLLNKYSEVEVFDPAQVICRGGVCQAIRDGKPMWMDDNHISESASYLQGAAIAHALKEQRR